MEVEMTSISQITFIHVILKCYVKLNWLKLTIFFLFPLDKWKFPYIFLGPISRYL